MITITSLKNRIFLTKSFSLMGNRTASVDPALLTKNEIKNILNLVDGGKLIVNTTDVNTLKMILLDVTLNQSSGTSSSGINYTFKTSQQTTLEVDAQVSNVNMIVDNPYVENKYVINLSQNVKNVDLFIGNNSMEVSPNIVITSTSNIYGSVFNSETSKYELSLRKIDLTMQVKMYYYFKITRVAADGLVFTPAGLQGIITKPLQPPVDITIDSLNPLVLKIQLHSEVVVGDMFQLYGNSEALSVTRSVTSQEVLFGYCLVDINDLYPSGAINDALVTNSKFIQILPSMTYGITLDKTINIVRP